MKISAEYIWIDGNTPTKTLRSKNQILNVDAKQDTSKGRTFGNLSKSLDQREMFALFTKQDWWQDRLYVNAAYVAGDRFQALSKLVVPDWGFDGSSTAQADTHPSDRPLRPVCALVNPIRSRSILVLCEVLDVDGKPHPTNTRHHLAELVEKFNDQEPLFGIEQEYTLFEGGVLCNVPYGWPDRGPAPAQGKYYCGVGLDEVPGHHIAIEHEEACRDAGLSIRGTNGEVMPGQWEFQTDTCDPLTVADHLWLSRYLLYRIAAKYDASVKLDPKPVSGDWNGAGSHTNFSTLAMRDKKGLQVCEEACHKLGARFEAEGFPSVYGAGFERRLTGAHETCSFNEFKFGVADRSASVRIPLHVEKRGSGYIEDRRPCANADPYEVTAYLMETICN